MFLERRRLANSFLNNQAFPERAAGEVFGTVNECNGDFSPRTAGEPLGYGIKYSGLGSSFAARIRSWKA